MGVEQGIHTLGERAKYHKWLIYGPPGVGKTVLAASAPNPLHIDVEKEGTKSLLNFPEYKDNKIFIPRSTRDLEDLANEARKGKLEFSTFIVDTVSELQRTDLDEFLAFEWDKQQKSKIGSRFSPYLASPQDYQISTQKIRQFCLMMRDLPANVIFLCHDKADEKKNNRIRPDVTPKLAASLVAMMDLIGYLYTDFRPGQEPKRKLLCRETLMIEAKNRYNLPPEIEDPTWSRILGASK